MSPLSEQLVFFCVCQKIYKQKDNFLPELYIMFHKLRNIVMCLNMILQELRSYNTY